MKLTRKVLTLTAGLTCALVASTATPASASTPSASPVIVAPTAASLHFMTAEQFAAEKHIAFSSVESIKTKPLPANFAQSLKVSTSATAPADPPGSNYTWDHVMFTSYDQQGRDWPTRSGNDQLGWAHFSGPSPNGHNLYSEGIIIESYQGNPDVQEGSHFEFPGVVTDGNNVYVHIRVVAEENDITADSVWLTPDGRPVGTITAFCEGYDDCPDWVNSVPTTQHGNPIHW